MTVSVASMPNFRDVGGRRTRDGTALRMGVLYRSDQIPPLPDEDARVLAGLGLRYIYDLRTEAERSMLPDERVPGATHVALDVLADDRQSMPARLLRLLADPGQAESMLGEGRGTAMFVASYRSFVELPSARAAFRRLFEGLAEPDRLPAVVHCTTGKDRTGWAVAALLLLLGVPRDDVMAEYLLTNEQLLPALSPMFTAFADAGGDPAVLHPVLGVRAEYLNHALHLVREQHGSIEGYFTGALGLGEASLAALRGRFLVADG